jgi:hypothetical protein
LVAAALCAQAAFATARGLELSPAGFSEIGAQPRSGYESWIGWRPSATSTSSLGLKTAKVPVLRLAN